MNDVTIKDGVSMMQRYMLASWSSKESRPKTLLLNGCIWIEQKNELERKSELKWGRKQKKKEKNCRSGWIIRNEQSERVSVGGELSFESLVRKNGSLVVRFIFVFIFNSNKINKIDTYRELD